jgi:hypothetical protein
MITVQPQFSVFLVNKPGVLASVTEMLANAGVNIIAMAMMDSVENGVMRFICDDPDQARTILGSTGEHWSETDVLVILMNNEAGTIAKAAKLLSDEHISVAYAYITGGAGDGITNAVFKVSDTARATDVFNAKWT